MTIEQALEELANCGNLGPAVRVVCAEVRRLRARVEAVRGLNTYRVSFRRGFDDDTSLVVHGSEESPLEWYDRDNVLAALEITDD